MSLPSYPILCEQTPKVKADKDQFRSETNERTNARVVSEFLFEEKGFVATHLSTGETNAAVPLPNISLRVPFFSAARTSAIGI